MHLIVSCQFNIFDIFKQFHSFWLSITIFLLINIHILKKTTICMWRLICKFAQPNKESSSKVLAQHCVGISALITLLSWSLLMFAKQKLDCKITLLMGSCSCPLWKQNSTNLLCRSRNKTTATRIINRNTLTFEVKRKEQKKKIFFRFFVIGY